VTDEVILRGVGGMYFLSQHPWVVVIVIGVVVGLLYYQNQRKR